MDDATALLMMITGRDRPGVTSGLFEVLAPLGARVLDMEQVVIRDHLVLGILVSLGDDEDHTRTLLAKRAAELGVDIEFQRTVARRPSSDVVRHYVTILGQPLPARAIAGITARIAGCGANIDSITRLSRYPITSFELLVSGCASERLRRELSAEAAVQRVDVAVQRATLYRRAKRLIVLDVDSTLVQGEVIEILAGEVGAGAEVAAITAAAMTGELDFEEALRRRVALLEGLDAAVLDRIRADIRLTPGARTLMRTLRRLGYVTAIVSGGFTQITDDLAARLGIDHTAANTLEIVDGRLTGKLVGPVIDRAGKSVALERFASAAGVPLSQTVAVGDGANDLDMLSRAGLGIAFNAKPIVAQAADTAVNVPYLDVILFVLGITREEVEAADAEDAP